MTRLQVGDLIIEHTSERLGVIMEIPMGGYFAMILWNDGTTGHCDTFFLDRVTDVPRP